LVIGLADGLIDGLLSALLFGLIGGLAWQREKIEPVEIVMFSWKDFLGGKLVGGLLFGLVAAMSGRLFDGLIIMLLFGPIYKLFNGLDGWLVRKQLSERQALTPNDGIKRSFKNGLVFLLVVGLVYGLLLGLVYGLFSRVDFGLRAVIQHFTLRFWLWRSHLFPWKIVPFLEDSTTRVLLRRVGGGYSFTHRLLLDYFADLDTTASSPPASVPPPSPPAP
jgi:predicted lipid-binding transport protein (Tim44 family)